MNRNKVINSFCSRKRWGEVLCLVLLFLYPASLHADEGMWMLGNLNKETRKADRKSTRLNSSHNRASRMPSSA